MEIQFESEQKETNEADYNIIEEEIDNFKQQLEIELPTELKVTITFIKIKKPIYLFLQIKKKLEMRRIPVPPHRFTPLKANWEKVVTTIVVINNFKQENMKLQVRMNL